ncbi:hypothetical protein Neosp_005537 [[Neocosmospora] mangrovei]
MIFSRAIWTLAAPSRLCKPHLHVVAPVPGTRNLENLAVTHDGNVLVTSTSSPAIHYIHLTGHHESLTIAQVPGFAAVTGITETEKDVFYVSSTNLTGDYGTNAIWKLDLRYFQLRASGEIQRPAVLSLVANIPDARLLNGMTLLNNVNHKHILVSDSTAGTIIKVNVDTGKYTTLIQSPVLSPTATGLGIGVNGIRTYDDRLYFVNLDQGLFASFPISSAGAAVGNVDVILNGTLQASDDFAISRDGKRAWIAENGPNILIEVDIPGKTSHVAANSTVLGSTSSVALSQTKRDQNSLYITGAGETEGQLVVAECIE